MAQHLRLRPEDRREVVVEQADLEQRRVNLPLDLVERALVRRPADDEQHDDGGHERDDGQAGERRQRREWTQQQFEDGAERAVDRGDHEIRRCSRGLSASS
jgi:hypothetical protein